MDIDLIEQCIELCRENSDCTHFTHGSAEKVCSLKKADKMKQLFAPKRNCGYFPSRSSQSS